MAIEYGQIIPDAEMQLTIGRCRYTMRKFITKMIDIYLQKKCFGETVNTERTFKT